MRRVLFVTDHIHHPQGGGGAERNTHDLCIALRSSGVQPAVASSFRADNTLLSWSARLRRVLPPRTAFPRDTGCGYPVFRGWDFAAVAQVVRRFRPDVAVVQSTLPTPLFRALAQTGVPAALYVHEVVELDPLAEPAAHAVPFLANSEFTARRLLDRFGVTAPVVRPLIRPADYRAPASSRTEALFVNTVPRKGLEVVLRLADARPDIPFSLVTSWILTPAQHAALAARAAAAGNVTLHPPTRDMRPHYARAKVLLAPSQWEETWGRVATEAHVNGIPVLASDRGGLPESVGPGGTLLPADAPDEAWQAALARLWDDRDHYARQSAAAAAYAQRPSIQPSTIVDELCRALSGLAEAADRTGARAWT